MLLSNQHIAIEYEQKASLVRFYQALVYDGHEIDSNERLLIMNSLFSKADTGLVKSESYSDMESILALLSKNLK